ncbi:MAG: hypothetical protein L0191_20010, partial [Acidobacteria bacterium]|nr:hypothetical protein [Acidobacteriota bacterium]
FVALEPWDVLWEQWWTATLGLWVAGASILVYAVATAVAGAPGAVAFQRVSWVAVTALIITGALVYPVTVTFERTAGFRNEQSLNGLVNVQKSNPTEYEAVQWLKDNVSGTPTILEAVGGSYSDGGRVSSRTGLPAVLGWPGHEGVWRGSNEDFVRREEDIRRIYETTDVAEARGLLERYQVDYVYVGHVERQTYGAGGLAKFVQFLTPVFQNGDVTIYRMPETAALMAHPD